MIRRAKNPYNNEYEIDENLNYKSWEKRKTEDLIIEESYLSIPTNQFEDITDYWLSIAKPGVGKVINRQYYIDSKGREFITGVNNNKIILKNNELDVAEWLVNKLGGNVYLNPEIAQTKEIKAKASDYYWRGNKWDLKTLTNQTNNPMNAIHQAIKGKKEQSQRYIFDMSKSSFKKSKIIEAVENQMRRKQETWVKEIMIINNGVKIDFEHSFPIV